MNLEKWSFDLIFFYIERGFFFPVSSSGQGSLNYNIWNVVHKVPFFLLMLNPEVLCPVLFSLNG